MEDFLGILALILYLVAAAFGKRKKTQKKRQQQRRRESEFDQAYPDQESAAVQITAPKPIQAAALNEQDCDRQRMHLHKTTQQQMHLADEGEDPCHAGGAPETEEIPEQRFSYDEEEAEHSAIAQDVLRGMIMSEILIRPCDRAALRRNRRSAVR